MLTVVRNIRDADLKLTPVADGVHELRLPIPWEDEFVNTFLLTDGPHVDLIDCGIQEEGSVAMIRSAVAEVGGPGARLRRLVITHIHPDHFGAAGVLAADGSVEVLMHRLEVPMVHPRYLELEQLIAEVGSYLTLNGVPLEDIQKIQNASRSLRDFVNPAAPFFQLDGAETIQMGRRRLKVVWTPGHSPGHVCLFDEGDGLLFAGDQLLPDISPNIGLHPQSTPNPLDDFLASLDHLLALGPRLVLPAHGRPFDDPSARVARLRSHHLRRKDQIVDLIGGLSLTAWEVALRIWGERSNVWEKRLALQEALAHLQSLAVEGRVEKSAEPGGVTWSCPPATPDLSS